VGEQVSNSPRNHIVPFFLQILFRRPEKAQSEAKRKAKTRTTQEMMKEASKQMYS
jgi:hypothetical protein